MTNQKVVDYVMNTPNNTNPVILKQMLKDVSGASSWNDLKDKPFGSKIETYTIFDNVNLVSENGLTVDYILSESQCEYNHGVDIISLVVDGIIYAPDTYFYNDEDQFHHFGVTIGQDYFSVSYNIYDNGNNIHWFGSGNVGHTMSAILTRETVHKLDAKYLPNSVWLESEEVSVYENYDTGAYEEGFYVSKTVPNLLKVGDTVHIELSNPIEGYGYPSKVSYDIVAVQENDHITVVNPDVDNGIIWQCNFFDGERLALEGNAFQKLTLSITKNTVKTNCDLWIKGNEEELWLESGNYAAAKAKLQIGMPVSVLINLTYKMDAGDGTFNEEIHNLVEQASMLKNGDNEYIGVNFFGRPILVLPNNTVIFD